MSSLKDFFYEIATEMGRPKESMDPVIKIFEENWYDTVESIRGIDVDTLSKMKVPLRLIEVIQKKLGGDTQAQKETQSTKMIIEEQKKEESLKPEEYAFMSSQLNKITINLDELKRYTIKAQTLLEVLNILEKVLSNIVKDPSNEKFRTLSLTNEKLKQNFFAYPSIFDILSIVGFRKKDDILHIQSQELNITFINQVLKEIDSLKQKTIERQAFDPYKSSFSATGDVNMSNIVNQTSSNYDYGQKLEELKIKRLNAVKPYIENKEVKLLVLDPNVSIQSFLSTRDEFLEEDDTKTHDYLIKQEIMRWAKEFDDNQQFSSRRRKEFDQLLKQPLFTESRIRVRFPNNQILEAKFSPREPVKNIVDLVRKYLVNPNWDFYLYMTPPVQKITSYNWNKTLEEAEMVPNMLLYFGTDKPLENVKEFLTLKPETS